MPNPTLQDIADDVGMSPMTVSRALRGVSRVSETTRQRIRQSAERLGYVDSRHGLLAAPRHRGTTEPGLRLLVVTNSPQAVDDEISCEVVSGMESRLGGSGGLVCHVVGSSLEEILAAWEREKASGLVLRAELPAAWVQALAKRGPIVYGASFDFHQGVDAVYSNELRSAGMVQEYLASHGHRHVLWLGQTDQTLERGEASRHYSKDKLVDHLATSIHGPRYAAWAYVAGLAEAPALRQVAMFERDWRRDSLAGAISRGVDAWGTLRPAPSAIVVPSDSMGVALLKVLEERGIRVPEDISVICYGGTSVVKLAKPTLTAVKLPMYTIGRAIPELIERRLADPEALAMSLMFEAELIPGQSVSDLKKV